VEKQITHEDVARFEAGFDADPKNRLALNAVTKNGVGARCRRIEPGNGQSPRPHLFELDHDTRGHQPEAQWTLLALCRTQFSSPGSHVQDEPGEV